MFTIDPRFATSLTPENFTLLHQKNPPAMSDGGAVMTGAVRLNWPSLSKPAKPQNPNQAAKYQASGLFAHQNIALIQQWLEAAVRQHYPSLPDPKVFLDPKNLNHPLKDQGLKVMPQDGGFRAMKGDPKKDVTEKAHVPGYRMITAKSNREVQAFQFDRAQGKVVSVPVHEQDEVFYPGCWVSMKLIAIKSTAAGNPGVSLGLQGIMFLAHDTRLGGSGGPGSSESDWSGSAPIDDPNEVGSQQQMLGTGASTGNSWE
jgi:hypothetical protein